MDTVVVLGAAGGVGRGIAGELLAAGYSVVAVGRSKDRLQALARDLGESRRLQIQRGSVASDEEASTLMVALAELASTPRAVIASICGNGASARLVNQPASFLRRVLDEDVVSHFVAARHFLPLLAESGREASYLLLSGPAAECAWSGYGHRSVAAAALRMLTLVVREEVKDLPVRVQQLQICRPVRTGRAGGCECPDWPSAEQVGRRVVDLIAGVETDDAVVRFGGYDGAVESLRVRTTNGSERFRTRSLPGAVAGEVIDHPARSEKANAEEIERD